MHTHTQKHSCFFLMQQPRALHTRTCRTPAHAHTIHKTHARSLAHRPTGPAWWQRASQHQRPGRRHKVWRRRRQQHVCQYVVWHGWRDARADGRADSSGWARTRAPPARAPALARAGSGGGIRCSGGEGQQARGGAARVGQPEWPGGRGRLGWPGQWGVAAAAAAAPAVSMRPVQVPLAACGGPLRSAVAVAWPERAAWQQRALTFTAALPLGHSAAIPAEPRTPLPPPSLLLALLMHVTLKVGGPAPTRARALLHLRAV